MTEDLDVLRQYSIKKLAGEFLSADAQQFYEGVMKMLARLDAQQQELQRWQTCANCGQALTEPGQCPSAEHERQIGLEQMYDETLIRAEKAEQCLDAVTALCQEMEASSDRYTSYWANRLAEVLTGASKETKT